jgi:hypothetical protein
MKTHSILREYKMTVLEMQALMRASQPLANETEKELIAAATEVWKRIALRCGCDYKTVQASPSRGPRFFLAVPTIFLNNTKNIS